MLSGAPAAPRPTGAFRLRPPLEDDPGEPAVALPEAIDMSATHADNVRLYRVLGSVLAGRREFASYAVRDADLVRCLRAPGESAALEECFLLADGYRVACRLSARYPGIRADLRWACALLLARWRQSRQADPAVVLDALLALAIDGGRASGWLGAAAAVVLPWLAPLAHEGATADHALAVARHLAPLFDAPAVAAVDLPDDLRLLLDAAADADGDPAAAQDADGSEAAPDRLPDDLKLRLGEQTEDAGAGRPLTAEEIARLIERGIEPRQADSDDALGQAGLYVTQLAGRMLAARRDRRHGAADDESVARARLRRRDEPADAAVYLYDEWDYLLGDYRPQWCRLRELEVPDDEGAFFAATVAQHASLVREVRRHFQRLRPETLRILRGLEDGDDFDLGAVVDARADARRGHAPSAKVYTARTRQERDVATVFLLDMSASTDETVAAPGGPRRIIDIAKEALVLMGAALEGIGDAYAMYGFSGEGREHVEFYPIKSFGERLTPAVKGRLGGIAPKGSTRMGTALRHALTKMRGVGAPSRHLILLSDGFPQDLDYGDDRRSHGYGIRDTAVALREVRAAGIRPFCITVDLAGHDYLREMCDPASYLVIEQVADLPRELPKIYQRLVRATA